MDPQICPNISNIILPVDEMDIFNEFTIRKPVEQMMTPIFVILGLPGTIISFIVWSGKHMRYSSSIYLAFLAVSDGIFIMCYIVWHVYTNYRIPILDNPICQIFYSTVYLSVQFLSPILTLAFSVERYISICWPFTKEKLCSIRRAVQVSIALEAACFIMASPNMYFYAIGDENNETCDLTYNEFNCTVLMKKPKETSAMFIHQMISELLINIGAPFIILLINIRVIVEMWKIYKANAGSLVGYEHHNKGATTITLLCVSFYLITANIPTSITHLYEFVMEPVNTCLPKNEISHNPIWQKNFVFQNFKVLCNLLSVSYFGAKFYIYMGTSASFRKTFRRTFLVKFVKNEPQSKATRGDRKCRSNQLDNKCKVRVPDTDSVNLLNASCGTSF